MAYTVKKTTSYGKRVENSFKGIGAGLISILAGTILLFWNEGEYVAREKTIGEAQQKAKSFDFDEFARINEELDGRLIHASGFADTKTVLSDELFGVSGVAIALKRKVEYYQHVEHSREEKVDKFGGSEETTTTYTYPKEWKSSPVDSAGFADPDFRNANKILTRVDAKSELSTNVTFGAYKLPKKLVERISDEIPANASLTPALEKLNADLGGNAIPAAPPAAVLEQPAPAAEPAAALTPEQEMMQMELGLDTPAPAETPAATPAETLQPAVPASGAMVHVLGNEVYIGRNPGVAQIGDVRITLTKVVPTDISIMAEVSGKTFQAWTASNDGEFLELRMGTVSKAGMIASARHMNKMRTWIFRIIGTLLVIGGLKGVFGFLTTVAKVVPFVASIIGAGVGLICGVVGFAWSLIVIALAWLTYRPMIGVPMLAVAIAGIWYLKKVAADKKKAGAQPATEPAS